MREQIRLIVNVSDKQDYQNASQKIVELSKKGYNIVDTCIDNENQYFVLEKGQ